jgi:FAD/FMN-containing dehydrogenase
MAAPIFPGLLSRRIGTGFGACAMTWHTPIRRCSEDGELWVTDVCVPISRLAECIAQKQKELAASFLPAPIVGHAGDGNFHVLFVLNPSDPREMAEAERLNEQVVHPALSLDGICTGEHGIGCGKLDFLIAEHDEAVSVMHAIKRAIDPDNIMNPGKILKVQLLMRVATHRQTMPFL